MGWTKDQQKAIETDTGKGNLLVSAAAGSGKTAVLVERILKKIIDGKSTIDRLLIVTFTEAAASEMREKIIKRLGEHLGKAEDKKFIKSQIRLAETADIMTIDAFCSRVVKNNFHALGIDPNFGVGDDSTIAQMRADAIDRLFEKIYTSDDEEALSRLRRLTDFYAKDRTNAPLVDMIYSIYNFTESFNEPEEWLKAAVGVYSLPPTEWHTVKYHETISREYAKRYLDEIATINRNTGNEQMYDFLKSVAEEIYNATDRDGIYSVYKKNFDAPKKRNALIATAEELPQSADNLKLKSILSGICELFTAERSKTPMGVTHSADYINKFYESEKLSCEGEDIYFLFTEFMKEYKYIKDKKGVYEFSDIEHLAYELFKNNEQIRNEYRDKYDEILIDEYQDTNMLQDTIFYLISNNNIFMVGDLKQSIYRFRKGDPYIFKSKAAEYKQPMSPHTLITLSQNFRSRKEVLNSVNDIFSAIMSETAGDVDYNSSEYIVRDDEYEYYPTPNTDLKSELHYLAPSKSNGIDSVLCEAEFTARKIAELLNSNAEVYDKSIGRVRPIQKRDIVILESSVRYNNDILTKELNRYGIDSYVDIGSFFDRREITIMLSLISVINNMHRDIPLISVMRSPIGGFTDDELALIKVDAKHGEDYISSVRRYIKEGEDRQLKARLYDFVTSIYRWRDYVRKKSVSQLIWAIYEETCFYDIMGALEEGEEAQTNLRLLYERAKQFENGGAKGLFNFIKYIEQMEKNPKDIGSAKLIGENHDVVRVMTIHKSKGLEFPYVFLLGMGRMFPRSDNPSLIRMHKDLGIAMPQIYYDKHYAKKTHSYELISAVNNSESISEHMRLLYVAMTRAKEKLYAIICQPKKDDTPAGEIIAGYKSDFAGKLRPEQALKAKGFYDWILPAACSAESWKVFAYDIDALDDAEPIEETATKDEISDETALKESVYKILDYQYPNSECFTIPSRTSVTQLKELSQMSDDVTYEPQSRQLTDINDIAELMFTPLHQKPSFMLEDGTRPASEIGTLYHLVMSQLDLSAVTENGVRSELVRLIADGVISEADLEFLDIAKIERFFECGLCERMKKAKNIYRERPFQINISAREYDPSLSERCCDETIILQGIIDCFFEEDDGFVLFDYKTDKVRNNSAEIKERYQKQLDLYARAIEELTKKKVKEKYLYLFDSGEVI